MCVNNLSKVALDSAAAGIEPATSSHKSNALTTAPPSYTMHNTYTAPHTRTWQLLRRCRVTEREDVQSVSCRLSPHTWASSLCSQTATCSSGLPFLMVSTPVIHVIHGLLLIYRPQSDGRLSWPAWLIHSRHRNHKVVICQP